MLKKLLIGLAAVIVLVIVAAIAVPFFIPLDTYKGKIVALVKSETGRDLKIAGPVHFSLLPSVALEANDVSLANPAGAASPNMVQLKRLDVELKLFPLLHGGLEISQFKLVQPVIALEVDKQGKPSWAFTPAPTAGGAPPAAQPAAPSAPAANGGADNGANFSAISLGDVSISDGQASYLDQRTGEKKQLTGINMTLSLPSLDEPFAAKGSAVWDGEKATLTVQIEKPGTLQHGGASPVSITFAANPINFAFKGDATGATLSKLTGGIDLSIPSVRGLAKWAGVAFDAPGTGFGPMTLSGKIDKQGDKIAFSNAVIGLDAIKATGALSVDTGGAKPVLAGRLDVDKLDVNPYLPPENKAGNSSTTASNSGSGASAPAGGAPASAPAPTPAANNAKTSGWSDAPIDMSPLKLANADFNLSANSILYRKIQVGKSALALHLKDGRFEADLSQIALYQGKGQGKFTADGSGATPAIAMDFDLSGVAIQALAKDAADFDKLSGTGSIVIDVAGHGKSQREIVNTLGGKGSLNLANGKIEGVNLVAFVKNTASALTGAVGGGNATDFGALTGTYTITSGILKNNDLKLTSPEVPMSGAGTVDLPARQVNYRLTPNVAGLLAVPVDITGPWDNLSYRPDLAGIAKGIAQDPGKALDVLKNGGGSAGSSAGGLLKGLLGK
ncbi:MAG TPA: AsmA family protein [Stellaceae bacterium]|nr:AsmA family protein [Stellaceae bacterium]